MMFTRFAAFEFTAFKLPAFPAMFIFLFRRGHQGLHGQTNLTFFINRDDLDRHLLFHRQEVMHVLDKDIGDLRDVNQSYFVFRELHKRSKIRDTGNNAVNDCTFFQSHKSKKSSFRVVLR